MDQNIKNKYLEKSIDITSIEDIDNNLSKYSSNYEDEKIVNVETKLSNRIVFTFIMTDFDFSLPGKTIWAAGKITASYLLRRQKAFK